ncbi:MAG TPA: TPM domain-containing protein [Candidatus Coprovivens excrementavium]|nr:TPM domain-containing protein [Candidatus Coprovivens excrementavium]
MKKIYFIILCFIAFILPVKAFVTTYDRTADNNYGVNKKWEINESNINNVLRTPLVDSDDRIYDFANILNDNEIKELNDLIEEYEEETGFTFVFLSADNFYTSDIDNEDYAVDFYDYNDFGIDDEYYSGIILYRNANISTPYYAIYTFGETQLYYDDERLNDILDTIYNDFYNKDYMNGIYTLFDMINMYYKKGIPKELSESYIDENGFLIYKKAFIIPWGTAFILAYIVTAIFIAYNIIRQKMVVKAKDANEYLNYSSIHFSVRENRFINSHTTSHYRNSGSSSSSSRSSRSGSRSRSGSSRGGHGGGGRRG